MPSYLTPLIEQLIHLVNQFRQFEAKPRHYGTPDLIYVSEIHVIDIARRYPDFNLSQIAEKLGVTRGAVWQTVRKLEEKGLVYRERQNTISKERHLRLTERGEQAFAGFRKIIEQQDASITAILSTFDERELASVTRLINQLDVFLTEAEKLE